MEYALQYQTTYGYLPIPYMRNNCTDPIIDTVGSDAWNSSRSVTNKIPNENATPMVTPWVINEAKTTTHPHPPSKAELDETAISQLKVWNKQQLFFLDTILRIRICLFLYTQKIHYEKHKLKCYIMKKE